MVFRFAPPRPPTPMNARFNFSFGDWAEIRAGAANRADAAAAECLSQFRRESFGGRFMICSWAGREEGGPSVAECAARKKVSRSLGSDRDTDMAKAPAGI